MDNHKKLIKFINQNIFITLREARELGINPMMLSRLVKNGVIYRVAHGVYTQKLDWLTHPIKKYLPTCELYPEAIICGVSALTYYDLTEEEERQIWITLPAPRIIHNPRYRIIRPSGIAYTLGIKKYSFGKRVVRMYDLEKTIVDTFKYHTEEVALKALKGYLKRKNKNIQKLCDYARKLKKPLDDIVTILMAEE